MFNLAEYVKAATAAQIEFGVTLGHAGCLPRVIVDNVIWLRLLIFLLLTDRHSLQRIIYFAEVLSGMSYNFFLRYDAGIVRRQLLAQSRNTCTRVPNKRRPRQPMQLILKFIFIGIAVHNNLGRLLQAIPRRCPNETAISLIRYGLGLIFFNTINSLVLVLVRFVLVYQR